MYDEIKKYAEDKGYDPEPIWNGSIRNSDEGMPPTQNYIVTWYWGSVSEPD